MAYTTTAMRYMMTPWMSSLAQLKDILLVLFFILTTSSIAAVCAFQGSLFYRCRTTPAPVNGTWPIAESVERLCNAYGNGEYNCPVGTYCGSPDMYDLELDYSEIQESELTYYGAIGFDNVGRALLACFQVITYDEWAIIMYRMQDASSSVFSRVLFPILVFLGAFFCLNLIVAVIVSEFQQSRKRLMKYGENATIGGDQLESLATGQAIEKKKSLKGTLREGEQSFSPEYANSKQALRNKISLFKLPTMMLKGPTTNKEEEEKEEEEEEEKGKTCFSQWCTSIQENVIYHDILVGIVITNLLILALDRKGISDIELSIMDILDSVFFILFFIEMIIGIGASGFRTYLKNKQSLVDFLINLVGIIEVIFTYSKYSDGIEILSY